jgi:hypothetical protein
MAEMLVVSVNVSASPYWVKEEASEPVQAPTAARSPKWVMVDKRKNMSPPGFSEDVPENIELPPDR